MRERALIERLLKPLATASAARGLADDAAVMTPPLGRELVLTHDMLAAGVHYLPDDPPEDVAWKLLAVNLSDLAAMGARPLGVLMGLGLSPAEDDAWIERFTAGLARALDRWGVTLLGGDTIGGLAQAVLGLTAIGQVERGAALGRGGARPGDDLYITGTIGDAGLGLAIARGEAPPEPTLLRRYRRPEPRLALGQGLVGVAHAAMDVSDGLLLDAERLGQASGVAITIELARLPLSEAAAARTHMTDDAWLARASSGDDYELLFAAPASAKPALLTLSQHLKLKITRIGAVHEGAGLKVLGLAGDPVIPPRLGYEHGADRHGEAGSES